MIRIVQLSEEIKQELERMSREESGRVAFRAMLILWAYQDQQSVPELAKRMGWKKKRVRKWLKRFVKEGVAGLYDLPRSGRKSKADITILSQIATKLDEVHPPQETKQCIWTIGLLVSFLKVCFRVEVHPDTVRRWVHNLRFRWKRPKHEPGPTNDPRAQEKIARIAQVYRDKRPEDTIVYQDETSIYLLPLLRAVWSRMGQQLKVLTYSGWNKSIKIFGAIHATTGKLTCQIYDRCNAVNFISFLEYLLTVYPQGTIYMVLDGATYHLRSRLVKQWLLTHPRIQLLPLPTASPRLNPIEKIWWYVKPRISGNKWHGSIEALTNKAIEVLNALTEEKSLQLTRLAA